MRRDPFSVLRLSSTFLKSANNAKAIVLFIIAFVWQLLLNFSPILIGLYVLLDGGDVWRAVKLVVGLYVAIGLFLAFWPIVALIRFVAAWVDSGFIAALVETVVMIGGLFLLFSGPEWLMYKAQRYAAFAAQAEAIEQSGASLDD
jgi:hypothetical protein